MDSKRKKELKAAYRQRDRIGGVYKIECAINNKCLIDGTTDINGSKNRFEFSKQVDSCLFAPLREDWDKYGTDAFNYSVLETLKQKEEQPMANYLDELVTLKECLKEEYPPESLY